MNTKACDKCGMVKPLSEYHRHHKTFDGHTTWCKPCQLESNKKWKLANKEKIRLDSAAYFKKKQDKIKKRIQEKHKLNPWIRRFGHLKRTYGLTKDQYTSMMQSQGGVCAICKKDGIFHVDHCHKTGIVRGILCNKCNSGLGMFKDDLELLVNAIEYLAIK